MWNLIPSFSIILMKFFDEIFYFLKAPDFIINNRVNILTSFVNSKSASTKNTLINPIF
jgi:hypothetical protein